MTRRLALRCTPRARWVPTADLRQREMVPLGGRVGHVRGDQPAPPAGRPVRRTHLQEASGADRVLGPAAHHRTELGRKR